MFFPSDDFTTYRMMQMNKLGKAVFHGKNQLHLTKGVPLFDNQAQ